MKVSFSQLVAGVRSGEHIISFPTDTVPALAVRPDCAGLIFTAKQRSMTKPLILMGATAEDLWPYVCGGPDEQAVWRQVADQFWPGALTLVLPASDRLPAEMNPANPATIGIRVPNRAIARQVLSHTGPLATTSANRSGQPPLTEAHEIEAEFPTVLLLADAELTILDSGNPDSSHLSSASGVPSTVAEWTGHGWTILRQGAIKI